jgi:hypothetical protein
LDGRGQGWLLFAWLFSAQLVLLLVILCAKPYRQSASKNPNKMKILMQIGQCVLLILAAVCMLTVDDSGQLPGPVEVITAVLTVLAVWLPVLAPLKDRVGGTAVQP